ncbi:sensor histidine kinase [Citricoccus sp. GCM10030269]|uniref:sensor histidine kinase n=1 Tax=Citricoccus sp. GCM10030269 TaxID=3273388 RepID=UPI003619D580
MPSTAPAIDRRDATLAAVYIGVVLVLVLVSDATGTGIVTSELRWPATVSVPLLLLGAAATLWRRRAPVVVLVVTGLTSLAVVVMGAQVAAYLLLFEALFEPVMHGSRRLARVTTGLGIGLTATAVLASSAVSGVGSELLAVLMTAALVLITPLVWGWEVRHHREARHSAEALANAEQELAASRTAGAVETERRRIAHDLHDVISGHLSAVSLHTNLAESLPDGDARSRSLQTARDSAHAALRDLRSMIGVLAEDSSAAPQVTLSWDSLADRLRGVDAQATVEVDPAVDDPDQVAPSVQAALLRMAAEAVTNATRHGTAPITMSVRCADQNVEFQLVNRRAPVPAPAPFREEHHAHQERPSDPDAMTGVGLTAIGHRAAAVGGSVIAGPDPRRPDHWRVWARLPDRLPTAGRAPHHDHPRVEASGPDAAMGIGRTAKEDQR